MKEQFLLAQRSKEVQDRQRNTGMPAELMNTVIKQATNSSIIQQDRITKGLANEVYAIKTDSSEEFIVR
jgi:hypothetical protein